MSLLPEGEGGRRPDEGDEPSWTLIKPPLTLTLSQGERGQEELTLLSNERGHEDLTPFLSRGDKTKSKNTNEKL